MMTNTVASSITATTGAPTRGPAWGAYRTKKSFASVQFDKAGKGRFVYLPEGALIHIVGPSCLHGCLEVTFDKQVYNAFKVDLLGSLQSGLGTQPSEWQVRGSLRLE